MRTRSSMGKAGSIASLEELEAVGKAQVKKQMEWASGKYAARWGCPPLSQAPVPPNDYRCAALLALGKHGAR